ncbi:EamA family transporter RarD [Thalassotalea profundi]|uniref:Chloramphenicol resistance permease RarD n=1 Tax=Thalassotalea profundi TaxID=2036687 RepID=A0ABQ3IT94_9GAMM|nr:EamA family transporter RarD [Thalassotalea profundi]GHE88632.1 chloramphenicol resistance permease RarD [Thalassotalea profundi]
MTHNQLASKEQRQGVISAISAYFLWGIAPIYFKLLDNIGADEIMVHRVLWSCLLLLVIIVITGKWRSLALLIKNSPKLVFQLAVTALILGVNWFLFIWAINNDHLLDASLGYYINPLLNVALGMLFLHEKLSKWQLFAVLLAVIGVLIQVVILGSVPIISLALAGTFGIYGLLRKKMAVDSFIGLLIESILMLPIAAVYWWLFISSDTSNLFNNSMALNAGLILAGVVTTAPLLCFTAAAKRLTLSTLGFFQYIGPSIMFLLATFYYQEPLSTAKIITFVFIWVALVIYSLDSFHNHKKKARQLKPAIT